MNFASLDVQLDPQVARLLEWNESGVKKPFVFYKTDWAYISKLVQGYWEICITFSCLFDLVWDLICLNLKRQTNFGQGNLWH